MTSFIITTFAILFIAAVCLLASCTAGPSKSADRAALGAVSGSGSYICPLNGEELPCPKCCPLNQE